MIPRRTAAFAAGVLALFVLVGVASNAEQFEIGEPRETEARPAAPAERGSSAAAPTAEPVELAPIQLPEPMVYLFSGVGIAGLIYLLSRQRFSFNFRLRRPSMQFASGDAVQVTEEEQADAIVEITRDLIDELKEGDSPRIAIQRAYAAVETGFGAQDLSRKLAETPLKYLDRVFGRHAAMQAPLRQLTDLFQLARFSEQPVDESMRASAIEALTEIRDYYRVVAARRSQTSRSRQTRAESART